MNKELIINATPQGVEIALLEEKKLVELHHDLANSGFGVGDLYLGKVRKLMPGMNAAFVEVGFEKDGCKFILQKFDNKDFAENFMITVGVTNVDEFRKGVIEKELPQKFGIRIGEASDQPYGREVNIIDIAGVCWHFVQQE